MKPVLPAGGIMDDSESEIDSLVMINGMLAPKKLSTGYS
jgi:hypothetical protein